MSNIEPKRIEDLLADDSFLRYCRGDEEGRLYWDKQIELDPALKTVAEKAKQLYGLIGAELANPAAERAAFKELLQEHMQEVADDDASAPVYRISSGRRRWLNIAAAAVVLMAILSGIWWYGNSRKEKPITQKQQEQKINPVNDAFPGKNTATLILDDGTSMLLDSMGDGAIANQGQTQIIKLQDGQILYKANGDNTTNVLYNTMRTPKGGQYQLVLPDGTKVWLNAASSIRYPAAFAGNERKVTITGEAYFEVTKITDPAKPGGRLPFIVEKDQMRIEVLGTHFNANTYDDERDIKVTLLEGSVRVVPKDRESQGLTIQPGQQAVLGGDGLSIKNDIDLEGVMAWKNGLFDFRQADVKTIMRQIGRWYDLEVHYEGNIPSREFSGKITRNTNLSNVLRILEQSNIHFKLENNKIIVKP